MTNKRGSSTKFEKISKNKLKLVDTILNNDKVIQYSTELGRPDIENITVDENKRKDFFDNNFILNLFTADVEIENKIMFLVTPVRGRFPIGTPISDEVYTIDILCPVEHWFIRDRMIERVFVIAEEISNDIDDTRLFGIGRLFVSGWETYKLNDDFGGLTIQIEVSDISKRRS